MRNSRPFLLDKYLPLTLYLGTFIITALCILLGLSKYISILPLLFAVFVVDYIYFLCWKKYIDTLKNKWARISLYTLHILPYILLLFFFVGSLQKNITDWSPFMRTYVLGVIAILLSPRMVVSCLYLIWIAIHFALRLIRKNKKSIECFSFVQHYVISSVGLLIFLVLAYSSVITAFDFRVEMIDLRHTMETEKGICNKKVDQRENAVGEAVQRIPENLKGYRIVQISDMHIGSLINDRYTKKIVNAIELLQPDIIVFTGDMVNFSSIELYSHLRAFSGLYAKDGIYAILGNHDYGEYATWPSVEAKEKDIANLRNYYKQLGWLCMDNRSLWITHNGDSLRLVGVENWGNKKRFPKKGDLKKALLQTACRMDTAVASNGNLGIKEDNIYTILLSHDPSHYDSIVYPNYPQIDLCLSGHTHGMQIGMRIKEKDYTLARGLYEHDAGMFTMPNGQRLYVNTGLGFNGLPFRIGIRPSITLFLL